MIPIFDHVPFPGPTVSASLIAASRAAGEAYARRVLLPGSWEEEELQPPQPLPPKLPSPAEALSLSSASFAPAPPPAPETDSSALFRGLKLTVGEGRGGGDDDEEDYWRVLAVEEEFSSPSSSSSPWLSRPTFFDLMRDEEAVSLLETEAKVPEGIKRRSSLPRCRAFDTRFLASRLRLKPPPPLPAASLTENKEVKKLLGIPTFVDHVDHENDGNENDDNVDNINAPSLLDLVRLPSASPPLIEDEQFMRSDDGEEEVEEEENTDIKVDVVFLEEQLLPKRASVSDDHALLLRGKVAVSSMLHAAALASVEFDDEFDKQTCSLSEVSRSWLLAPVVVPPRPKPLLVDLAAVEFENDSPSPSSSSSSHSSSPLLIIEATALAPLGASASRERSRRRALGKIVEPVLASLLAPALPMQEVGEGESGGAEETNARLSRLLDVPGAPKLASLASEELRKGPAATLLSVVALPSKPLETTQLTQQQQQQKRFDVAALLDSLRPTRHVVSRIELRLSWELAPPGAMKKLCAPRAVAVDAAVGVDVGDASASRHSLLLPSSSSSSLVAPSAKKKMNLLEDLARSPPPQPKRVLASQRSPAPPLLNGWRGATGIFAADANDQQQKHKEQRCNTHAAAADASRHASRPPPTARQHEEDVEFFVRTTAAVAAGAAAGAEDSAAAVAAPAPRSPPDIVEVSLPASVARVLRALAADEASCLSAASAAAASASGALERWLPLSSSSSSIDALSLFDHASATDAAARASRDPVVRRSGVSHALAAAALARRLAADAARYGASSAAVRLEGALRAVPTLRRSLHESFDAIAIEAAGAAASEAEQAAAVAQLHPLSAALRDTLRTEAALSSSSRTLVLTEAAGFVPLIHAAAAARVQATQVGERNNGGGGGVTTDDVATAAAAAARDGGCVLVDREKLYSSVCAGGNNNSDRWQSLFARGRFTCVVDFAPFTSPSSSANNGGASAGDGPAAAAASAAALEAAPAWTRRVVLKLREGEVVAALGLTSTATATGAEEMMMVMEQEQQTQQQQQPLPPPVAMPLLPPPTSPQQHFYHPPQQHSGLLLNDKDLSSAGPWDTDPGLAADELEEGSGGVGGGRWQQQQQRWPDDDAAAVAPPPSAPFPIARGSNVPWQRYAEALFSDDGVGACFGGGGGGREASFELSPSSGGGAFALDDDVVVGRGGFDAGGGDPLVSPPLRLSAPLEEEQQQQRRRRRHHRDHPGEREEDFAPAAPTSRRLDVAAALDRWAANAAAAGGHFEQQQRQQPQEGSFTVSRGGIVGLTAPFSPLGGLASGARSRRRRREDLENAANQQQQPARRRRRVLGVSRQRGRSQATLSWRPAV